MKLNPVPAIRRMAGRLRNGGAGALIPYKINWPQNYYQLGMGGANSSYGGPMTYSAVFAAVDRISSDVAKIPIRHWRGRPGAGRDEVLGSAPMRALHEPNGYQTTVDLIRGLVVSQLYRGNGYIWGPRNGRDEVESMHLLSPDGCHPYRAGSEVFYRVAENQLAEINYDQFLPARDVLHHRMMTLSDPLVGVSPLMGAGAAVASGMMIHAHSNAFFANMARPGGYLTTAGKLDPKKAEALATRWAENYASAVNSGKTAVLEQGLEYKPLTMTAVDAQLIEQAKWTVDEIASVFHLPNFLVGSAATAPASSAEALMNIYLSSCLDAHFVAIEERLNTFFELNGTTDYVQFDRDQLFRTDLHYRVDAYTRAITGGMASPDEARAAAFSWNPIEGGDQVFMQQQMIPISMLAEVHKAKLVPPAPPPVEELPTEPDPAQLTEALRGEITRRMKRWAA